MAAPTPTARGTPAGIHLEDGYQTLVTFSANTTISFWEKTVTPPGMDGGDAIEQSTMHNVRWRTFAARSLITLTEGKVKAAYDPNLYNQLLTNLNQPGTFTITFPDGSTLAFFGYLRMAQQAELVEGTQPEIDITIQPTNFDPVGKVEADPVLTSVAGT